jgi:hypothetical protein
MHLSVSHNARQAVVRGIAATILGVGTFSSTATAQSAGRSRAPGNDAITIAKLRADLEFLAGDGFRGRLTNTPENALALEWMKSRFQWLGLKPMGANGTFFQPYELSIGSLAGGNDLAVMRDGGVFPLHTRIGILSASL